MRLEPSRSSSQACQVTSQCHQMDDSKTPPILDLEIRRHSFWLKHSNRISKKLRLRRRLCLLIKVWLQQRKVALIICFFQRFYIGKTALRNGLARMTGSKLNCVPLTGTPAKLWT